MAELVDALGSGPSGGNTVEVRVLFWAPYEAKRGAICGPPLFISRRAALFKWMAQHNGFLAVRAGGNDIDRHPAHLLHALQVGPRGSRQLVMAPDAHGAVLPAWQFLVDRLAPGQ